MDELLTSGNRYWRNSYGYEVAHNYGYVDQNRTGRAVGEPMSDNLPALIDRASRRLQEARTSAEVLEAKAVAEAALHYAKVTKAANETHADCLRMIVRAEMRMATEIDKGQASGEVAAKDISVRTADSATLEDLGVTRQRLSEWRDVRDAGEEAVEKAISEAVAEGRAPTKADIRRAATAPEGRRSIGPPSNGLDFARLAIMRLEEIRTDDTERAEAFALVRRWLDARKA